VRGERRSSLAVKWINKLATTTTHFNPCEHLNKNTRVAKTVEFCVRQCGRPKNFYRSFMAALIKVGDFLALPVHLPPTSVRTAQKSYPHVLYIKQHTPKIDQESAPSDRTLFVTNPPLHISQRQLKSGLKHVFKSYGVESVILSNRVSDDAESDDEDDEEEVGSARDLVRPGTAAYIVFEDSDGLDAALAMDPKSRKWPGEPVGALDRWKKAYSLQRPSTDAYQREIDAFMATFDHAENEVCFW
jgi:hypothetical protein